MAVRLQLSCATVWRMSDMQDLDEATRRYRRTERAHEQARESAIQEVLAALRAGAAPTEVTARSPFSAAYVRRLAREAGIAPAPPGPKSKSS